MKYIKILIQLILVVFLTIILGRISYIDRLLTNFLPNVNNYLYIFVLLFFILLIFNCLLKYRKITFLCLIVVYSLLIFLTLFCREKYLEYQYIGKFYLVDWFKNLLTNKTIFINIVGNLVIFIPLGFILNNINKNKIVNIVIGLIIIVVLESIQFISKRGVLDLVDIFLNSLGLIISIFVTSRKEKKYETR